jgi:uncharacterized protein (DUF58 family)
MPTRSGWMVLFGGLTFLVAGRLFGTIEFLVVGTAGVAAVSIAVGLRQLHPSRLAIGRRLTPPQVPAGEATRVDLEIINHARYRSPLLRLHDSISGTRGVHLSLASLPGKGGRSDGAYRLPTTRRGVLKLGPIRIEDVDALGLARRSHRVETSIRLIVHPPIEPVPPIRVRVGDDPLLGKELKQSLGLSDEEFDGLRDYVPGDDLRKIHWPSSARASGLQVRQFRPPRHGRLLVVIDTRPPSDDPMALDATTSVAGSIAAAVLAAGDTTRIETTDGRMTPLVTGPNQLDPVLEFLALLEGGSEVIHGSVPNTAGTVVAVTADPHVATDAANRRRFAQRLRAAMVITVDAHGWVEGGAPTRAAGWIHLTGPGQLAAVWQLGSQTSAVST